MNDKELNRRQIVAKYADDGIGVAGNGGVLQYACQVIGDILSMMALHRDSLNSQRDRIEEVDQFADRWADKLSQRLDDLQETLGGVEAQVHELRNSPFTLAGLSTRVETAHDRIDALKGAPTQIKPYSCGFLRTREVALEVARDEWKSRALYAERCLVEQEVARAVEEGKRQR